MLLHNPLDVLCDTRKHSVRRKTDIRIAESVSVSYTGAKRGARSSCAQESSVEIVGDRCTKIDVSTEDRMTVRYEQNVKRKVTFLGTEAEVHFSGEGGRIFVSKYMHSNGTTLHFSGERRRRLVDISTTSGQRLMFSGRAGRERLVMETFCKIGHKFTIYYKGAAGNERRYKCENSAGEIYHFTGPSKQERLMLATTRRGVKHFFDGEKGNERKVRCMFPCGFVLYFSGTAGNEAKVMGVFANGERHYYQGAAGSESIIRVIFPCGKQQCFEGEAHRERVVSLHNPDGEVCYYQGSKNEERIVRKEVPSSGMVLHYAGPCKQERLVRGVDRSHTEYFYMGGHNTERLVETRAVDGTRTIYEGPVGKERIIFIDNTSKGTAYHYSGERNSEYITRMINSDGLEYFFSHQGGGSGSRKRMRRCEDGAIECYDGHGRNVILRCTSDGRATGQMENVDEEAGEESNGSYTCSICLGSKSDKYALECGHVLCFQCSHCIFASRNRCPVCRALVSGRPPLRIFEP
jgi:hypothetical protein